MQNKLKQGEALFVEGKIEEAEKCFLDFLDQNPEDAEVLNNLGVIHHTRGNIQEAEGYFLKALAIKEDYLDALLNLADLYQNAKRWEEAALQLEKSIAIDDQDYNLFNQLGTVYLEMGNTEKARIALKKSLELNPDQETIRESLERLEKKDMAPNYLPTPGSFRGAFAEINITPNVSEQNPVFLQGMGGLPRKATAVSEPLMMQLLLLEDDHFTKVLFITADLFGFGPEIVDSVRALTAQWGIETEGLILNASHTHYAPGTISHTSKSIGPFYSEYAKQIVQTIGQQLPILYNKLEECELAWGKTEAQIGVSRRLKKDGKVIFAPNPEGYYDKDTPFLFLHILKTEKKFLLINHGCHPTGLGSENVISADYPGYMRNALKSSGVVDGVMFLQGGAGSTKESVYVNGEVQFCEDSIGAKENGEILATQIINGLKKRLQPVKSSFFCIRRQTTLLLKPPPPPSVLAQSRDNAETDDLVREWASSLLNRFPNGDFPTTLAMEIQLISLGDKISFVTIPGEPVAELARSLKKLTSKPNSTFVLGYTNGLIGYLPTDVMIEEGGYETEGSQIAYLLPSALNTGTESAIISATEQCVSAAGDRRRPNGYGRYHLAKKKQEAFFVLSAGRCGTMTLAHLLNTATDARVWHHPQPDPIKESLLAYRGEIDKRKAFWKARYPIIHRTWSEGLIHGETDLLMTPFCDMLAEEIPDAKFIVLVRDPRDFVRSGMRRNYYHGHPWDFGRLRPQEGTEEFERWSKLDQFGKVCWLWRETYEHILKITSKIRKKHVFVLRFEDLVRDESRAKELFEFLGLGGSHSHKIKEILDKKFNAQTTGHFAQPEDWPSDLSSKLWNECGKIAATFGYRDDGSENRVSDDSCSKIKRVQNIQDDEKKKLLFLELPGTSTGGHLDHIVEHLNQDYQVKYIKTGDHNEITGLINWADLVWLEWANQMAIHVTNKIPQIKDKKVICRLHGYEVFTDMPAHINWNVVDHLVFVAKHKQEIFNQKFKIQSPTQTIIRNGINTNKFTIADNKQNTKRLVFIGHLNFRKGIPLLLQFYHELLKVDPDYRLYIRGEFQDPRLEMAARTMIRELSLDKKLEFVDWVEDLNSWLADKSHILSFSLEESFHYTIGNGMAAGLKPVIHAWNESREIWPQEFIFRNLEEFLAMMIDNRFEPQRYRSLLNNNHLTARQQVDNIQNELQSLADDYSGKSQEKTETVNKFQANEAYWTSRYKKVGGERTVGNMVWSEEQYVNETSVIAEKIQQALRSNTDGSAHAVMDFGCGIGRFKGMLERFADDYYGVDIVEDVIEQNKIRFKDEPNSHFGVIRNSVIPFEEQRFDIIFSGFVLQHVTDNNLLRHYAEQIELRLSEAGVLLLIENIADSINYGHMVFRSMKEYQSVFRNLTLQQVGTYYAEDKIPHAIILGKQNNSTVLNDLPSEKKMIKLPAELTHLQQQWVSLLPYDIEEISLKIHQCFERGHFSTVKCEQIREQYWEVEFALSSNDEGKGVFGQYFIHDAAEQRIFSPYPLKDKYREKLAELSQSCIDSPSVKLNERIVGYIFDQALLRDVQENLQEYIWERMYPGTIFTPLNNFLTHMNRYRFVKEHLTGKQVIVDAACGIGYGAKYLSRYCEHIIGIDLSGDTLAMARKYYNSSNIAWKQEDVLNLGLDDESVDVFTSMETFEHVYPPEQFVREMYRVLRETGEGFISTPNGESERRQQVTNPYHEHEYSYHELISIIGKVFPRWHVYGATSDSEFVEVSEQNRLDFDNLLIYVSK